MQPLLSAPVAGVYSAVMFGFVIKKSFFDLWDNFLPAILVNLGFIALLVVPATLPSAVSAGGPAASLTVLGLGVVLIFVYMGGVFGMARAITDYQSLEWASFLQSVKSALAASLLLAALGIAHVVLLSVALPVYSSFNNMFGLFALAMLFWMSVVWWITAPFYLPLHERLNGTVGKSLKKAFIFSFDNAGFAIGLALGAVVIVALSFFTAFLVPGVAGLAIWYHTAVRLRLYKYDYLEEHPDTDRREIPWDALLFDDRERIGKRTFKGMIFPWKD